MYFSSLYSFLIPFGRVHQPCLPVYEFILSLNLFCHSTYILSSSLQLLYFSYLIASLYILIPYFKVIILSMISLRVFIMIILKSCCWWSINSASFHIRSFFWIFFYRDCTTQCLLIFLYELMFPWGIIPLADGVYLGRELLLSGSLILPPPPVTTPAPNPDPVCLGRRGCAFGWTHWVPIWVLLLLKCHSPRWCYLYSGGSTWGG